MIKITWNDGSVLELRGEKEVELRAAFGPKRPTYEVGDVFWRDQAAYSGNHYLHLRKNSDGLVGLFDGLDTSILQHKVAMDGYHRVKDISAITLDEVQTMTRFPVGLRHVPAKNLVISEK